MFIPVVFCFFMSSFNLLAHPGSDQWNLNRATASQFDTDFDLSDKTFSAIFQNIKPCKYITANSIFSNDINDSLLLLHLNIRSLQKNLDDLCEIISGLSKQPHIICISETKIKNSTGALINISYLRLRVC